MNFSKSFYGAIHDSIVVRWTLDKRIMLDSGQWIAAQDLRNGLRLKTLSGTVGVKSVAMRAAPFVGKVYNLKIGGSDRYLVGKDGLIVRDY